MVERKEYLERLLQWKDEQVIKVITGIRRCGKSTLLMQYQTWLKANGVSADQIVSVNFEELEYEELLDYRKLYEYLKNHLCVGKKTYIFLDEIQECQEAVTSLKFWAIDNKYDVIVSGSLLGIDYKRASSYPVGYVDYLKMYGIDFEEFLWGMGISGDMIENLCGYLRSKTIVPEAIHSQMMNYYRQYIAIGGMPEAVQKYIDTKDFREIDRIQRSLLQGYQYDIAHYATAEEKVKAEKCYLSLAKQLLDKENHKFQYKEVEKSDRSHVVP